MGYILAIIVWAAVPALVAVGLIGLGIWAIRTSRGDVSRAVGVLVIAAGILVIGYALLTVPSNGFGGRAHSVDTISEVIYSEPPITPRSR